MQKFIRAESNNSMQAEEDCPLDNKNEFPAENSVLFVALCRELL